MVKFRRNAANARLQADGEASTGKPVAEVRNKARLLAHENREALIISDCYLDIGYPSPSNHHFHYSKWLVIRRTGLIYHQQGFPT